MKEDIDEIAFCYCPHFLRCLIDCKKCKQYIFERASQLVLYYE